jgi:hypothetical protein
MYRFFCWFFYPTFSYADALLYFSSFAVFVSARDTWSFWAAIPVTIVFMLVAGVLLALLRLYWHARQKRGLMTFEEWQEYL